MPLEYTVLHHDGAMFGWPCVRLERRLPWSTCKKKRAAREKAYQAVALENATGRVVLRSLCNEPIAVLRSLTADDQLRTSASSALLEQGFLAMLGYAQNRYKIGLAPSVRR